MMQYLVILLDDTSVSYCHCENLHTARRLISLDDLKAGILYAMKENLMIQFVYPDYELPKEYLDAIDSIDHHDILPWPRKGDVTVATWPSLRDSLPEREEQLSGAVLALRIKKAELWEAADTIATLLRHVRRLNIVITDVETFADEDLARYSELLLRWAEVIRALWIERGEAAVQFNLLTDRMMLTRPNHCNAGVGNITLAPNGRYYLCPAFYYSDVDDSADPQAIKNRQLLQFDHAPLCRRCDAYHCRRCVWLNRRTTRELNTPSHEQCIVAHTERNAARQLLASIREVAPFMPEIDIKEINYIDPFEVRKER